MENTTQTLEQYVASKLSTEDMYVCDGNVLYDTVVTLITNRMSQFSFSTEEGEALDILVTFLRNIRDLNQEYYKIENTRMYEAIRQENQAFVRELKRKDSLIATQQQAIDLMQEKLNPALNAKA